MLSLEVIGVAAASAVACVAAVVGVIRPELTRLREEVRGVRARLDGLAQRESNVVRHVRGAR